MRGSESTVWGRRGRSLRTGASSASAPTPKANSVPPIPHRLATNGFNALHKWLQRPRPTWYHAVNFEGYVASIFEGYVTQYVLKNNRVRQVGFNLHPETLNLKPEIIRPKPSIINPDPGPSTPLPELPTVSLALQCFSHATLNVMSRYVVCMSARLS